MCSRSREKVGRAGEGSGGNGIKANLGGRVGGEEGRRLPEESLL